MAFANNKDTIKPDAFALTDEYLNALGQTQPETAQLLFRARNAMWGANDNALKEVTDNVVALPTLQERRQFTTGLVRLGQLYDLSSLMSRERALEESRKKVIANESKPLSGGIRDMVGSVADYKTAVEYLNKPVFEVVFTAHPTNVNAMENIERLCDLGTELHKNVEDNTLTPAARDAMRALAEEKKIIPLQDGKDLPGTITVINEIEQVLHYLENIYTTLPALYASYDEPLAQKAKQSAQTFDPQALFLNIRCSSWGSSGDKDGNVKVNADTTLEAIALHKKKVVQLYVDDLAAMLKDAGPAASETLVRWHSELQQASQGLDTVLAHINECRANDNGFMPPQEFTAISAELKALGLDHEKHEAFLGDLNTLYHETKGTPQELPALNLWRKVKTFDFNLARIEYRETAEEYQRVVARLIPEYFTLCEDSEKAKEKGSEQEVMFLEQEKCSLLESKLKDPGFAESVAGEVAKMVENGHGKAYDPKNPDPIGYHTMKRMELARDFPEMITANVLAECQNTSNLLEASLLQRLSEKDGKQAIMGIVPLFEEPATMQRVDKIMKDAYENKAYKDHLALVAGHMKKLGFSEGKITQQVQIAHSDNTRRSGLPAARAFIYEAHNKIRALNESMKEFNNGEGIVTQFFEGGSNSDPFRGGVRSISAATNMYGLHDFMKFTFQGGDNLGYFNFPGSILRLYGRNLSHAAKYLAKNENGNGNGKASHTAASSSVIDFDASRIKDNPELNNLAIGALKGTLPDYQDNVFTKDKMGYFLWITKDDYSNTSTRGGLRKPQATDEERIDPNTGMRTITFSESFQHAGIIPTWIGAMTLERELIKRLRTLPGMEDTLPIGKNHAPVRVRYVTLEKQRIAVPVSDDSAPLDPKVHAILYSGSSVYRDVIDRMAFGLSMTDLDHVTDYYPALAKDSFLQERLKPEFRKAASIVNCAMPRQVNLLGEFKRRFTAFLDRAEERFAERAAEDAVIENPATPFNTVRDKIREHLPHLKETLTDKSRFMQLAQTMKRAWREDWDGEGRPTEQALKRPGELSPTHQWCMYLLHNAIDCVTHGRIMLADDPMAMRMFYPGHYDAMRRHPENVASL